MRVDYIGIALLILAVGALQVLLGRGQEDDWFASHFMLTLGIVSAVSFVSLVVWEWRQKAPIIDIHMYTNANFAVANLMMFILGMLLFSSLVMMPQFLQTLMGYSAQSAGLVLSGAGLVLLLEMPIVGQLTTKFPAKYIMVFGWFCLALGMYFSTWRLSLLMSFAVASRLRVAQAFGLGFLFVPVSLAAYIGLRPEKGNSSGRRLIRLHAEHRRQRRHVAGHDGPGAAGAVSSVHAVVPHDQLRSRVPESGERDRVAARSRRRQRARCAAAGLRAYAYPSLRSGRRRWPISIPSCCWRLPPVSCACCRLRSIRTIRPRADRSRPSEWSVEGCPMAQVLTIEREYGSGAASIAEKVAARLGWKLWDQVLTDEICRRMECDRRTVERHEERKDPLHYRLFKAFLRGSFEGSLNEPSLKLADAESIRRVTEELVRSAAAEGNAVIVGRGSAYYLHDHPGALHVFVYAPFEEKVRRLELEKRGVADAGATG